MTVGSPFQVAFDDATLVLHPTWTTITQARSFEIARGRSSELDKTGTGTANVGTIDLVGALDPTNPTGPAYGKLDPMKQARVRIVNPYKLLTDSDDTTYNLFRGYVETWGDFEVSQDGRRIEGGVQLVDMLELLAQLRMMPGHGDTPPTAAQGDVYLAGGPNGYSAGSFKHVDDRLADIADMCGIPTIGAKRSGLRDFFSGNVSVLEQVYARADQALNAFDDAVDAELPFVATRFVSKDGVLSFRGRYPRFFPEVAGYGVNEWFLGGRPQAEADPANVVVISRLPAFRRSALDIINASLALPSAPATAADAAANLVTDSTSIDAYGYRSRDTDNLLTYKGHNDDLSETTAVQETKKFARYRVGNYKDPKTRVGQVQIVARDPRDPLAAAQWDFLTRVELNDLVNLETTHPGGGGFDNQFFVEGLHYTCELAPPPKYYAITLTLDLSPREFYDYNPFGEVDSGVS